MARYKHIDTSPRFLPLDLQRQMLPAPLSTRSSIKRVSVIYFIVQASITFSSTALLAPLSNLGLPRSLASCLGHVIVLILA